MKRIRKWLPRIFIALVLLFIAGWQVENWRGNRAWKKAQARAEAAGVSLDTTDFTKAPIPDDENLLKNETFLAEWNGEIEPKFSLWEQLKISGLDPISSVLGPTPLTGHRFDARKFFKASYSSEAANKYLDELTIDIQKRLDQLAQIILSYPSQNLGSYELPTSIDHEFQFYHNELVNLCWCFQRQGALSLHLNRNEEALRTIKVLNHLRESFNRPSVFQNYLGLKIWSSAQDLIWEGLALHSWNSEQLTFLHDIIAASHPVEDFKKAIQTELFYSLNAMEHSKTLVRPHLVNTSSPSGFEFVHQVKLYYFTEGPAGWKDQRKSVVANQALDNLETLDTWHLSNFFQDPPPITFLAFEQLKGPFDIAKHGAFGYHSLYLSVMKAVSSKRIALIAIAAEQHYLKSGTYPASLDEMQLDFDTTDATDPKQRPLAYQLDKNGRPEIWSLHETKNSKRPVLRWQFWEVEEPKKTGKKKRASRPGRN